MNTDKSPAATTAERSSYEGAHILTADYSAQTDIWESQLNNNVLVFGPSGAGKTRNYVLPNILTSHESMIILDPKGTLHGLSQEVLKERGYKVLDIDFTDLTRDSGYGYDPFDAIRYDSTTDRYKVQDILTLCKCLVPILNHKDPYWDTAARQYLLLLVTFELESEGRNPYCLEHVFQYLPLLCTPTFDAMVEELDLMKVDNTTSTLYNAIRQNVTADRMHASIVGILSTHLETLVFEEAQALYRRPKRIRFTDLAREKTALFVTISDTDRSLDSLADIFMTQAIQALCYSADHDYPERRLPIPVRFYFDDFATSLMIPDFDKTISTIRSREISVSVILQSLSQLNSLYGADTARTILNNCDRQLYLGGQDLETATYISRRSDKPLHTIMTMPFDSAYLIIRGELPRLSKRYHLPEASPLSSSPSNPAPHKNTPAAGF